MPDTRKLVIIESPAKARSLRAYLGEGYDIIASNGHVRDLPRNRFGVSVENGFRPMYTIIPEKRRIVEQLRKKAGGYDEILLAADPDREGEAICWHVADLLGHQGTAHRFQRLRFNEISRQAVLQALAHPEDLDLNLVDAQQARRVMDRLIGYRVSPYLSRTIARGLSAGRVQTVALRLVREREDSIEAFIPRDYWTFDAGFRQGSTEVRLRLTEIDGKAVDTPEKAPSCEAEAGAITSRIEGGVGSYCLSSIRRKENRRSPGPPFITSTLQQAASQSLSFSPSRTMRTAQELYEGVQLGRDGETSGLITYMRTDSVRLSPGSVRSCRDYIAERFGAGSLPPSPRRFRASKAAQDAHEAIRPVDVRMDPESLGKWLTSDQAKLYSLIWRRFIATQMAPALIVSTTVLVSGADGLIFKARGELVAEPGFLAVDPSQITTEKPLPELEKGPVELIEVLPELRTTRPPTRFSEAGLVAEMKNKGIGRPSTYVPIIDKIKQRKYVQLEGGRLIPTELGTTVLRLLVELFPYIFEIGFTSDMEGLLDDIAEGKIAYADALGRLNTPLESSLAQAMANLDRVRERLSEETDERCPVCGAPLKVRWGRFGRFMACSAFPDCRFTRPLDDGEESSRFESRVCPECGGKGMLVRNGRYGRYLACSNASSCRHTEPYPTGASCPEEGCDGELVERKSKRGKLFYSCSNYPSCRFATWNEPVAVVCPRCGYPFLERRKRGGIYCPRCKKKIQLEKSRPGTSADS